MKMIKDFLHRYRQSWILLYVLIYFPWFFWLENHISPESSFTVIHLAIDDMIPFCEYFLIPYYFWFLFVAGSVLFFLFRQPKKDFYRFCSFLFIGMTISLIIYGIFPNGQLLRPSIDPEKNIFCRQIAKLYQSDTPTNVFPSIHVFASIGVSLAWWKSPASAKHKWIRPVTTGTSILICLSTVLIKQHSVADGIGAMVLAIFLYYIVYQCDWSRVFSKETVKSFSKKRKQRRTVS